MLLFTNYQSKTMTISLEKLFVYDEGHYMHWAIEMTIQGKAKALWERISYQEMLNHISTVFFIPPQFNLSLKLGGCEIEIQVGKEFPSLQALMRERNIKGIVGMTPKFPIQNPSPTPEENRLYVESFQSRLNKLGIDSTPANGRARDFREGGNGCFLLIDVSPEQVMDILEEDGEPTQLSITYLPARGKAQLLSCVEKPKEKENRLKTILKKLSYQERAIALSFLGAILAGTDYPSATSPALLEFMLHVKLASPESQLNLAGVIVKLLQNPELFK